MTSLKFIVLCAACTLIVVNTFLHSVRPALLGRRHAIGHKWLHAQPHRPPIHRPAPCSNSGGDDCITTSRSGILGKIGRLFSGMVPSQRRFGAGQQFKPTEEPDEETVHHSDTPDIVPSEDAMRPAEASNFVSHEEQPHHVVSHQLSNKFVYTVEMLEVDGGNSTLNGTWVDGKLEGYGEEAQDGYRSVGQFVGGKLHGIGTKIYPDGTAHVGEWKQGKPHGQGTRTSPKGHTAEGLWQEGVLWNGTGALVTKIGDVFSGTWVEGELEGAGEQLGSGYHYTGEFRRGREEGFGTKIFPEGTTYVGEWKEGKPHGQGTRTSPKGHTAEGVWREGALWNGRGAIVLNSGDVRRGTWVEGKLEGAGEQLQNRYHYTGEFRRGLEEGFGTKIYPEGTTYVGEWKEGKPHGQGTKTSVSGYTAEGVWQKGALWNGTGAQVTRIGAVRRGTWVEGKRQGFGESRQIDGSVYSGDYVDNLPHGNGVSVRADGTTRIGEWAHGTFVGESAPASTSEREQNNDTEPCTHPLPDGSVFVGGMAHCKPHGQGKRTDSTGQAAEGVCRNGKLLNGTGVLEVDGRNKTLSGTWVDGKLEGHGEEAQDGYRSVGQFVAGKLHGNGTKIYPDGATYVGEWLTDKQHGQGNSITSASGHTAEGVWREGALWNGQGAIVSESGDVRCGTWTAASARERLQNKNIERNTHTLPDGSVFVGEMASGKPHGQGKRTDAKGQTAEGVWRNGILINGTGVLEVDGRNKTLSGTWVDGKLEGYGETVSTDGFEYRGQWRSGLRDGHGTQMYPDGTTYVGEWKDGKQHGPGKMTCTDGRAREGEWREGKLVNGSGVIVTRGGERLTGTWINTKMEGPGECIYSDGNVYKGEFHQGLPHGNGTLSYANGSVYTGVQSEGEHDELRTVIEAARHALEGEWREGKLVNGSGVLLVPNVMRWTGTFVNCKLEGPGESVSADGRVYVGHHFQGLPHGNGTKIDAQGRACVGEWRHGMFHSGRGVMQLQDGTVLEGTWVEGKREGPGETVWPGGAIHTGEYCAGLPHGVGAKMFPQGGSYVGEWARGKPNGVGRRTYGAGVVKEGMWVDGKFVCKVGNVYE